MYIKHHKQKDIVIIPKHNENLHIKSLNKIDIKQNDKSYENIKNIVLENSIFFFFSRTIFLYFYKIYHFVLYQFYLNFLIFLF